MKRDSLDLIDQIGRINVRPFLAPVPDAGSVVVSTIQEGIRFRYRIARDPGWWVLYCDQTTVRRVESPTSMFDIVHYLEALPRFLVIAVHRLHEDTWMVVPWNYGDAGQRGWSGGEPRAVHLVRDSVRPFDILVARRLGPTLLYDTMDAGLGTASVSEEARALFDSRNDDASVPGAPREMEEAHDLLRGYVLGLRRAERLRDERERRDSVEGKLRWHLGFMGADLVGWHEAGEGYEVRWSYEGREYTTTLRRDFQVASAGICLDGTDQRHNLSSIVAVMEEARRQGRDAQDDW